MAKLHRGGRDSGGQAHVQHPWACVLCTEPHSPSKLTPERMPAGKLPRNLSTETGSPADQGEVWSLPSGPRLTHRQDGPFLCPLIVVLGEDVTV